ncbi:MAG TPA: hypothetical protein VHQ45_17280 [Gemmatimonadaceae bacterium]|jgi:hypothetical protein|nr:hypothetical protein [Gemmatimonadaceae bacterium]
MVNSALRPDVGLPELLAARARSASDARLALDVAGGLLVSGAALVWRPTAWFVVLSGALCFAAFGCWGIADRELAERPRAVDGVPARALRALRAVAAAVGTLAAVALLFGLLVVALGTWIS